MAWTAPITWAAAQLVSATDLNTHIRDNENFLYTRFPVQQALVTNAGNYTTTSTSFVDVDATNLILTITPATGTVVIMAFLTASLAVTGTVYFDLILDSTTRYSASASGSAFLNIGGSNQAPVTIFGRFSGLSNTAHTFKLQWKVSASTGTIYGSAAAMIGWESN